MTGVLKTRNCSCIAFSFVFFFFFPCPPLRPGVAARNDQASCDCSLLLAAVVRLVLKLPFICLGYEWLDLVYSLNS